jgi:hypothetical protein
VRIFDTAKTSQNVIFNISAQFCNSQTREGGERGNRGSILTGFLVRKYFR